MNHSAAETEEADCNCGCDEKKRSVNESAPTNTQAVAPSRRSCLQQLLGWIKQYEKKNIK
jgi:hypothetical protein